MPDPVQQRTLRERRRLETRAEIHRIALALVGGRGYDSVTVDMISDKAGVSVRTFFNYFPNKESAMIALPPPLPSSAVAEFLSHRGPRDLFADLADLAVRMFDQSTSAPSDFESSMPIVMRVPNLLTMQYGVLLDLEARFADLVAVRLGAHRDHPQPEVIAAAFTGAVRVACQRWSRNPGRRLFADELRACLTLLSAASHDSTGTE